MTQVQDIRYLSFKKGESYREIARITSHDFKTVKKYAEKEDFNEEPKKRKKKVSKLDPFKDTIDQWLQEDLKAPRKQRHTAKRVYERLCEEFGEKFKVAIRTVQYYVSLKKKELFHQSEGYLPLDHPAGEAQVDFGEAVFYENGQEIEGYYLNLSLPHSNAGFLQLFKGQNQECLLEGLKRIFEHMGWVPTRIWFDNLSPAVKEILKNGDRLLTERFAKFSMHYGFEHNFCNPNSGHEKGHVENKVGYHRRNFLVPIPHFEDLEQYNLELFAKADQDMNRRHYKKGALISALFDRDLKDMLSLPKHALDVYRLEKAKANKYGKIQFEKNTYSTSPAFALKEVWIKATYQQVIIMDEDYQVIVTHDRLYGKNKESMQWIPYLSLMAKRPNALKYTSFYHSLPDPLQDYLQHCSKDQKQKALHLLQQMLQLQDLNAATEVLNQTLRNGVTDTDSLLTTWHRFIQGEAPPEMDLRSDIPTVPRFSTNLEQYDQLLKGGEAL